MKKNFLKVAALLIAAMLMVVSCTQEVAPVDNELVDARLSVGYGRELVVDGDTDTSSLVLKYSMSYGWSETNENTTEDIIGEVLEENEKTFTDNTQIGYVTPGLWNIKVNAYENESSTSPIFTGTASVYYSSLNDSATIYLAPVNVATNSINFEITMQDLAANPDEFELRYSIYKTGASDPVKNGKLNRASVQPASEGGEATHVSKYTKLESGLASGYYRVTVYIYESKEGGDFVGGVTKGFLISGGATANISGHVEPSDYENVKIDTVFVNVETKLSIDTTNSSVSKDGTTEGNYKVSFAENGVTVKVELTDSTSNAPTTNVVKTMFWTSISDKTETTEQSVGLTEKEFNFTTPGYKYITCTTVYEVTGTSTGMTEDKYYFADSETIRVFVDPSNS